MPGGVVKRVFAALSLTPLPVSSLFSHFSATASATGPVATYFWVAKMVLFGGFSVLFGFVLFLGAENAGTKLVTGVFMRR